MQTLTAQSVKKHLTSLPGWIWENNFLVKHFKFHDFSEATGFLVRVALVAERLDHHPNWSGVYHIVTLRLQTHDAGGVTEKDLQLAAEIEALLAKK